MNPADLSLSLSTISPTLPTKSLSLNIPSKNGKTSVPRIDIEPIYTQLKIALGNQWQEYKAAINSFVLGNLNQAELTWVLQPLFTNTPTILTTTNTSVTSVSLVQLHNQLVICLLANILRDAPVSDVAPWVVATDKPSTIKNAAIGANDKAEERLKREVLALHARDRRRVKTLKPDTAKRQDGGLKEMQDYRFDLVNASNISVPTAAELAMTSLDTRRKYVLPLASETLEFPSQSDMQNRIEPICYDEGLISSAQGTILACSELMEQAAEAYLKSILGDLQIYMRSNGVDCIQTTKFKQQLRKEEEEVERGILQKAVIGLLPVEIEVQSRREPLSDLSLQMAMDLRDPYISQNRFLCEKTRLNQWPTYDQEPDCWKKKLDEDDMMVDDEESWHGVSKVDQDSLMSTLDECLAAA